MFRRHPHRTEHLMKDSAVRFPRMLPHLLYADLHRLRVPEELADIRAQRAYNHRTVRQDLFR